MCPLSTNMKYVLHFYHKMRDLENGKPNTSTEQYLVLFKLEDEYHSILPKFF